MLLPFDTGLALSTLRVLAAPAGHRDDPATEEQPGKILHEVRAANLGRRDICCRRSTTAPSTPPRCSSACSPTPGAGAPTGDEVAALLPALRGAAWTG